MDRIEKQVHLEAPRSRVWRALSNASEFGQWFGEPTTLVVFELKEAGGGTLLSVVESGFDSIPISRRDEAFRMNSGGWEAQMKNIAKHLGEAHGIR